MPAEAGIEWSQLMIQIPDEELIAHCLKGDDQAWEKLDRL